MRENVPIWVKNYWLHARIQEFLAGGGGGGGGVGSRPDCQKTAFLVLNLFYSFTMVYFGSVETHQTTPKHPKPPQTTSKPPQTTSKPPQTTSLTSRICICYIINNFRTNVKAFLLRRPAMLAHGWAGRIDFSGRRVSNMINHIDFFIFCFLLISSMVSSQHQAWRYD